MLYLNYPQYSFKHLILERLNSFNSKVIDEISHFNNFTFTNGRVTWIYQIVSLFRNYYGRYLKIR